MRRIDCRLFYDLDPGQVPKPGQYMVTIGKRGAGSAYLILHARRVNRRVQTDKVRWILSCHRATLEEAGASGSYWPLYWYPRKARNSRESKVRA